MGVLEYPLCFIEIENGEQRQSRGNGLLKVAANLLVTTWLHAISGVLWIYRLSLSDRGKNPDMVVKPYGLAVTRFCSRGFWAVLMNCVFCG